MDAVLLELISAARRAGLRIGTSESLDALQAAAAVGLDDRETLRIALRATLAKRREDHQRFDRVFDHFFRPDAGGRRGVLDRLRAEGLDERALADLARRLELTEASGGGGGGLSALLEGGAELEQRIEAAMRDALVGQMVSPMQIGLFGLRTLDALGIERLRRDLEAIRGQLDPRVADLLAVQLDALRRRVRAAVRDDFMRRNPERLEQSRAARLDREAFAALDRSEIEQVGREVQRLGLLLRDRMERKRRRTRRGRLDVRATTRASLRTSGIPFTPVLRRRRRERPKLVVLCDVSDSVRAAARFLLVLVYSMQEAFSRTRSFVFVRDVAEATALFDERPIEEAVSQAFAGDLPGGGPGIGASSDYGRSLAGFCDRHLDAVDRRTTVVVLGDARNNQNDPRADALRAIARRAARVVWLNPEPRPSWGLGDSEMERYIPFCVFAAPVRSLHELREAVTRLASIVAR